MASICYTNAAHAYLDPSTGGMLISAIIGMFATRMGIIKISSKIIPLIKNEVNALSKGEDFHSMKMHHFLEHLCKIKQPIRVVYVSAPFSSANFAVSIASSFDRV